MAARKPIDYKPQTASIFRPKDVVEQELATAQDAVTERTDDAPSEQPSAVEPVERRVVRHSFDIYHDQLQALTHLQAKQFMKTGKKPKMGTLIQDALDAYIARQQEPGEE